jgi:hypothetical protein
MSEAAVPLPESTSSNTLRKSVSSVETDRMFYLSCALHLFTDLAKIIFSSRCSDDDVGEMINKMSLRSFTLKECYDFLVNFELYKSDSPVAHVIMPRTGRVCFILDPTGGASCCWLEYSVKTRPIVPGGVFHSSCLVFAIREGHPVEDWTSWFCIPGDTWLRRNFPIDVVAPPTDKPRPIPSTLNGFREQDMYILGDQLGVKSVLKPDTPPIGLFKGAQPVYLVSDCWAVRSRREWLNSGREVKMDMVARGSRKTGTTMTRLFSIDQTVLNTTYWTYPKFHSASTCNEISDFIECNTETLQYAAIKCGCLWSPAVIEGKTGVVVYKLHAHATNMKIESAKAAIISKKIIPREEVITVWRKLMRRILIGRLVDEEYMAKK